MRFLILNKNFDGMGAAEFFAKAIEELCNACLNIKTAAVNDFGSSAAAVFVLFRFY